LRLAYWHAVMSLPSVVLTPLAAFVLYRVARLAPRPPWPPRTGALSDSWNQA
jgi:hypothetical protein